MKAFKLYFKIFRSHLGVIIAYVSIFLVIVIINATYSISGNDIYKDVKVDAVVTNLDSKSKLSEGLINYLTNYANFREMKEEDIKDALFFRNIKVHIIIPKDFEKDFLAGKKVKVTQEKIEMSISTVAIDNAINEYLNYVRVYLEETNEDLTSVINLVDNLLNKKIEVIKLEKTSDSLIASNFYFTFSSYIIAILTLTVIGIITMSYRKFATRKRLEISPYSTKKVTFEMLLGNFIFTTFFVILLFLLGVVLYNGILNFNGLLLFLNLFTFSISILCIAYFFSLFIQKQQVLSGVNNVFSIGSSFLSGAFVPQELLGSGLLKVAHIFPNHYYITNVNLITAKNNLSSTDINKILLYMVIQLLFALVFTIASIYQSKKSVKQEE